MITVYVNREGETPVLDVVEGEDNVLTQISISEEQASTLVANGVEEV